MVALVSDRTIDSLRRPRQRPPASQQGSPPNASYRLHSLNAALCRFPLRPPFTLFWTGQTLTYPAVQNSGAAAEDHELTAPPMHFPQICSVRKRIRLEVTSPAGGIAGYVLLTLVYRPRIGVTRRTRVFGAKPTQQDISGLSRTPGEIANP